MVTTLEGWGRSTASDSTVVPLSRFEPGDITHLDGRGLVARGAGRSYNDAAQNAGGTVLATMAGRRTPITVDETGLVSAPAEVTIEQLLTVLVPAGWFVPVTPGTRRATLGGCLAADVHGKNHHVDGSWGAHVVSLDLIDGTGHVRTLTPDGDDQEAFWATIGGMGLTGVILAATFRAIPMDGDAMTVTTVRTADLCRTLTALEDLEPDHRYTVAWVDTTAPQPSLGRGVVTAGNHRPDSTPPRFSPSPPLAVPRAMTSGVGLVNRTTIRAFNEAWYRFSPKRSYDAPTSIERFFHPLDGVEWWNRLYGRGGFVQYQSVVPEAEDIQQQIELLGRLRIPSALSVLKRFGPAGSGLLSFPRPGWTLAVDIPVGVDGLAAALDGLDELVLAAGGRIYLAKDGRARPETVAAMYPRLDEWRAIADRLDPRRRFRSDLDRRLQLRDPRPHQNPGDNR